MAKKNNVEIDLVAKDMASREVEKATKKTNRELNALKASLRQLGYDSKEIDKITQEIKEANPDILTNQLENTRNQLKRLGVDSKYIESVENRLKDAGEEAEKVERDFSKITNTLGKFSLITGGVTSGLSGLTAAAAPAIVGVGALGASFAAAGVGAVAFGAVATSALTQVFEASEEVAQLEEKIANADSTEERIAAQKELAAVYADMSEAQRGALKELQNFKSFWGDFVQQFETPVFEAFGTSLAMAKNVLNGLAPTIESVSAVINELLQEMNNSVVQGGLQGFFTWLETNAAEALYNFAHIGGNLISGFFHLLGSFSPIGASMEEGLLSLTERFSEWASSLSQSTAFQDFIGYAMTNGPVLIGIVGDVLKTLGSLIVVLAPLGEHVLGVVSKITGFIASLKLSQGNMESFKAKAIEVFQRVKDFVQPAIDAVSKFVGDKIKQIKKFWDTDGEQFKQAIVNAFNIIKSIIQFVMPFVQALIKTVWGNIQGIINGALNIIMGAIRIFSGLFTGDFKKMWEGIKQMFKGAIEFLWNAINLLMIGRIVSGIKTFVSSFISLLKGGWDNAIGAMKTFVRGAGDEFQAFVKAGKEKFDEMIQAAKDLPGKIGKGIKDNFFNAVDAVKNLADDMVGKFKEALGINSPSKVFTEMGGHIMQGLVNGLSGKNLKQLGKSVLKDFGGGVLNSWDAIKGFFSGSGAGGNVKSWIAQAMSITGVPSSWASALETIAMKESGGRTGPSTINKWDSNWTRGTPSMGLMQTIMPTFSAYKMSGMNDVMNPVHNAVAAIRYIQSRYGTVFNTPGIKSMANGGPYRGYKVGGVVNNRQLAWLAEGGYPETVISHDPSLSGRSRKLWEKTGEKLGFSGGSGGNVFQVTLHYNGSGSEADAYKMAEIVEEVLMRKFSNEVMMSGGKG